GSSTVARFVLIASGPFFISGNFKFSAKLPIFVTRLPTGRKVLFSDPLSTLCKPLTILGKQRIPALLIVLDAVLYAASPPHFGPVALPTASPRAIVCRLRELSISALTTPTPMPGKH